MNADEHGLLDGGSDPRAGWGRDGGGEPAWSELRSNSPGGACPTMHQAGACRRRETDEFYNRGGGFSDSGRKMLILGVMVAIVNIST